MTLRFVGLMLGGILLTGLAAAQSMPPQPTSPLAPGTFRLTVTERELSLDAYEAPLTAILAEIEQRTKIPIVAMRPAMDERVTIHLSLMPMEKAFRQLSPNVAIATAKGPNAPPHRIAKIYVLPKGKTKPTEVEVSSSVALSNGSFQFTVDPTQH
jgi:hypothetical protein